jgi:hypothetical protein
MGNHIHMIGCQLIGHRFEFAADGRTLSWSCSRCGTGGSKVYPTPAQASRYATAFNVRDSASLGRRAPLIGLFPLRLAHLTRRLLGR